MHIVRTRFLSYLKRPTPYHKLFSNGLGIQRFVFSPWTTAPAVRAYGGPTMATTYLSAAAAAALDAELMSTEVGYSVDQVGTGRFRAGIAGAAAACISLWSWLA